MNFMNVFSPYHKLMTELCKRKWSYTVHYNDDDKDDPRIEFINRNQITVVRTADEARQAIEELKIHEPIVR